jgi:hypothetical protein
VALPAVWRETDERGRPGRLRTIAVNRRSALGLLQRASVIRVQLPWTSHYNIAMLLCD